MIRIYPYSLLIFVMALGISMVSSSQAHAQRVDMVQFTTLVNSEVKKVIFKALDKKVQEHLDYYFHVPVFYYGFVDLNNDNKNEIIVQFRDEFLFTDQLGNTDTHIFAQTSKGLIQVLETRAYNIGIGRADETGLKQIYAYQMPSINRPTVFKWDGQKKYEEVRR
jgi:hypothetical protein